MDLHGGETRIRGFTALGVVAVAEPIAPGLHVVATPIGNLGDITLRALAILAAADAVIVEDTRVTRGLLSHYGVSTPMIAYHEHNAAMVRPQLLRRLGEGAALALVSDAGLPTDRFFFEGFLPNKSAARRARINEIAATPATLVIFESPRRVAETLADLAAELGPRPAAVVRELTKIYEETRRGPLDALAAEYAAMPTPRGEIVVVVGPPGEGAPISDEALDALLTETLAKASLKDATAIVSARTGEPRRRVYARALALNARPK